MSKANWETADAGDEPKGCSSLNLDLIVNNVKEDVDES